MNSLTGTWHRKDPHWGHKEELGLSPVKLAQAYTYIAKFKQKMSKAQLKGVFQ